MTQAMQEESAISLQQVSKSYHLYDKSYYRFLEVVTGKSHHKTIHALQPISIEVPHGQVLGLLGNNGAGKSTILKLITGTAPLTSGKLSVNGRVVALLELGSGFHPELTGHDNIYLYSSILGIKKEIIKQKYQEIVDFSGLGDFIDNPVKTYSSGMFVRLAFSVATAVEPDILIIDEALSVGDGTFAHKSFKRIMEFKEKGKTILFCSHSMYHINAICDRAIWLEKGRLVMDGIPGEIIPAYNASMVTNNDSMNSQATEDKNLEKTEKSANNLANNKESSNVKIEDTVVKSSITQIRDIVITVDGQEGTPLKTISCESELKIYIRFISDLSSPMPHTGLIIENTKGYQIASASTSLNSYSVERDDKGFAEITYTFNKIALLQGKYIINVYLLCEKGIFLYDEALHVAELDVSQKGLEVGVVYLDYTCL